jgi:alanine transaminase
MYLFPTINLPEKAVEAAKADGKPADAFYCMELLKATGICIVPGSGFGQQEGSLHFRTTFLAPQIDAYCEQITKFHQGFMDRYR